MERPNRIYGVLKVNSDGCWIESTGIYEQHPEGRDGESFVPDLPINRVSIFVGDKYIGIVHITPDSGFFFSRATVNYEYYVDGKNLQLFFSKREL